MKKPTRLTTEQARAVDESIVRGRKVRSLFEACRALGVSDGCSIARDRIISNAIYRNHAEHETYGRLLRNRSAGVSGAKGLAFYLAKFGIELRCEDGYVQFFGRFRRPKERANARHS